MDTQEKEVEAYLFQLQQEKFNEQLNGAYGITKDKANPKMARIGFDAKENRLGWTLANLNWILGNYQIVESLLKDAQGIRESFKYAVFCGMGGSGLSVQLVKDTFGEGKVNPVRDKAPEAPDGCLRQPISNGVK